MLKVALTGGIATGKSYVLAQLRERGIPTIDADDIVHKSFEPGTAITQAVALEFGHGILKPDGGVDRSVLAAKVFTDAVARLRLEAIVHPMVYQEIERWFSTVDRPIAIASIPLLYETHRESDFDAVVVTACKADQQLRRLMERGLSEEEARRRMAVQIPTEEKATRADFVVSTSGTKLETNAQVDDLVIRLSRRSTIDD
jgi:dephospho-CoA kinase